MEKTNIYLVILLTRTTFIIYTSALDFTISYEIITSSQRTEETTKLFAFSFL